MMWSGLVLRERKGCAKGKKIRTRGGEVATTKFSGALLFGKQGRALTGFKKAVNNPSAKKEAFLRHHGPFDLSARRVKMP